jgi:putative phosphoesterase
MNIAILSDIHGNHYALEAVLKMVRQAKIEKILVLGDIVGYYYRPDLVLEQLAGWEHLMIRGNHEEILSDIISGRSAEQEIRIKYGSGHRMAIEQLSEEQKLNLLNANEKIEVTYDEVSILMCHGSPWQSDFYLYPDTSKDILNKCGLKGIDFVFVGHSHYPFAYNTGSSLLVNPGSVGQSRSVGGMACWALLNTVNGTIQLKSTVYDVKPLLRDIERLDPKNLYLKDVLMRNNHE